MPSPHYDVAVLSKSGGYSAVGRLAYIERGGQFQAGAEEVMTVGHSGPRVDWQQVDRMEYRRNASVVYEITLPIPHQLPGHEQCAVVQVHADHIWRTLGLPSTHAIHAEGHWDERNRNAHVMLPMRAMNAAGKFGEKTDCPLMRRNGGRARVAELRGHWQDTCNAALARCGFSERLDLRTLKAQGIDREAQRRIPKAEYEAARRQHTEDGTITSPRYAQHLNIRELAAELKAQQQSGHTVAAARRAVDARVTRDAQARADRDRAAQRGRTDRIVAAARRRIDGRTLVSQARNRCLKPAAAFLRSGGTPMRRQRAFDTRIESATEEQSIHRLRDVGGVVGRGDRRGESDRVSAGTGGSGRLVGSGSPLVGGDQQSDGVKPSVVRICTPAEGIFFARTKDLEAAQRSEHHDVPLCQHDGSPVLAGSLPQLRLSTVAASLVEPVVHEPARPQATPATHPKPSGLQRLGRWLSGADRRAARQAAEARAQAEAQSAAERRRREQEAREKAARLERIRSEFHRIFVTVERSEHPLVCFQLHSVKEPHFARREDWLASARSDTPTATLTIPLCDRQGKMLIDSSGEAQTVLWREHDWSNLYPAFASQPTRVQSYQSGIRNNPAPRRGGGRRR